MRRALAREGIEKLDAAALDIGDVPGDEGQSRHLRGRCQEAVNHRLRIRHVHPSPLLRDRPVYREDPVTMGLVKTSQPAVERSRRIGITTPDALDAAADLADRQDAQVDLLVIEPIEPRPDIRISALPLAQL